jgi:hypothetical protein
MELKFFFFQAGPNRFIKTTLGVEIQAGYVAIQIAKAHSKK